ncbi:MAG TPA: sodium:alanine symporter family protein [Tissierellia bacterium]|nr:sodium:alanine symporter family protein [Tissierellia bacterium]
MDILLDFHTALNDFVWGPVMLALLVGAGVYLTLRTNFFAILKIGYVMKNTLFKMFDKEVRGEGEITPFQAVSTALAATVGTGNVAGVATAIALGGPGAVFWMWISAIFGMTTKFAEVVLSIKYREQTADGRFVGGPMYYLRNGIRSKGLGKFLAVLFSIFGGLAAFGIGNMVQSNSVAAALEEAVNVPPLWTGIALAILTALVILGGIKRIGAVTEKLVPFMAAIYILGALFIIILNGAHLPEAFGLIFRHAFTPAAATGGFAGATISIAMRRGVSRGVFSNEAGLGSAPIAHAAATTDSPVRQGLWGVFEVFVDTIIICTLTAMAIMVSGLWDSGVSGAALTTQAFNEAIPGGGYIVSIGIMLFAFSTILGWSYYGERCAEFLFGKGAIIPYRVIWIPAIIIGSIGGLELLWDVADTLNGLMILPNIIGVILLSGTVISLTKDYFRNLRT